LDFSKIEAGKLEISPEKISVRDIVETVGQNLWLNAQTRNVSILTYIDPRIDSCLLGDPVRISQILINLMGNAVKFTENGTVSASVTVDSEEPDQAVLRFEVSDTGIGMNPDQTAKLFQPFSQVDVSSTRKYGGTGLGLAISRRLTEVMGGEIGVESVRDEGSTFWFCLPLDRLKGQAVKLETPYAGRRILICSRGSRLGGTGITRYLTDFGAECRRVRTVQEATAALAESVAENRPFDLVITQHHFDGEGAGDLVAYMTTQAELRDTPIILYAPRQDAMSETLKRELHFNDVIYRPFVLRQACAAIVRATGWPAPKFLKSSSAPKKQRSRPVYREPSHQAAAEAGALVLIAEDNLTNQIVLKKQLSRLGYAAEFADNGAKAMRLLVQDDKRYGLLLSDCQMPVMDGYELTRRIRAREENNGRHLPIIALTADAMDGTEERCLMAGMDGYLSKPVELAALDDVIGKWLPAADKLRANTMVQETFGAKAGPDLNESNAKMKKTIEGAAPIDKNRLVELIGTDEPEVLRDMLQCFFQTTRDKPAELKRLVETKNAGGLYNAAHAAKGASASVGAGRLADALKDLQDAADAADWPRIEALEPEVTTAFHEVHDAIEEELGKS
ncbi:MAG: ATP-binding protein, partial [Rhodospirillales bacterium]